MKIAEGLYQLLCCPRCAAIFDDYDGCNALKCFNCRANFCAVCLEDCGADLPHPLHGYPHPHYRETHLRGDERGGYYDRGLFDEATARRRTLFVARALKTHNDDREFVRELALQPERDLSDLFLSPADVLARAGFGVPEFAVLASAAVEARTADAGTAASEVRIIAQVAHQLDGPGECAKTECAKNRFAR